MKEKIQITAPIKVERKSKTRAQAVASILEFPENKQPDLLYFSAILVSSGENLNHAFFLPSELVLAEGTIVNKAVDREHAEEEVIGHIYDRVYLDKKGRLLKLEDLDEQASLDDMDMDIAIAGIIYKNRFPQEAEEVKNGDWCISMEAYYSDFDIKIGDIMIPKKDAEALGLIASDVVGKEAEVTDDTGKIIAEGNIARVLRNIIFAGCGIVKNPANPDSVFLEAANLKNEGETVSLVNITDKAEVEDLKVEITEPEEVEEEVVEEGQTTYPDTTHSGPGGSTYDTVSQCAVYNRFDESGNEEIDWCGTFDTKCTSELREQRDPDCLYYKEVHHQASAMITAILEEQSYIEEQEKRLEVLMQLKRELEEVIDRATQHMPGEGKMKKKKKKKKSKKKSKTDDSC